MNPDQATAELAVLQQGVFHRDQVRALGFSPWMIRHRLETRRWLRLHPGVYCLNGVVPSWGRDQMAACLWSQGPAAGLAAGHLHGLYGCEEPPIEVLTIPSRRAMARCGIVVHLTKRLPIEQITTQRGMPCTTVERTLMDLCAQFDHRRAAIAIDQALFRGFTTLGSLDHCLFLTARRGRNGCGRLREHLKKRLPLTTFPNSPLETVIFEMIVEAGLPLPELQYVITDRSGRFVARPDFVYPDQRLIIEGHSALWHSGIYAEESDRERETALLQESYRIVYVGWADALSHRDRTVELIRAHLLRAERAVDPLS